MTLLGCSTAGDTAAEGSSPSVDRAALPPIPIVLLVRSDIAQALLNRICAETEAIWGVADVTFDWQRGRQNDHSTSKHLMVTIDDIRTAAPEARQALGWIAFTPEGPSPSIHLSLASTEDLLRGVTTISNMTTAGHEMMVGRALGRALAHEIGHYLLKSKAHASHGLMRAVWPSDGFFAISRRGLEITAQERETAIDHLLIDAPHSRRELMSVRRQHAPHRRRMATRRLGSSPLRVSSSMIERSARLISIGGMTSKPRRS